MRRGKKDQLMIQLLSNLYFWDEEVENFLKFASWGVRGYESYHLSEDLVDAFRRSRDILLASEGHVAESAAITVRGIGDGDLLKTAIIPEIAL